ncbi:hypothetical protein AMTR_s00040p00113110 [Amborella trichopoda]|uniref:DUF7148 domain-containing protein n=2 Tax=Amborella trichopoda TaxID=13333 RepID=W1PZL7_AMBTC|nr:hypothetical protein AMTR_s00040p00113110 [Amborella trichopoda]
MATKLFGHSCIASHVPTPASCSLESPPSLPLRINAINRTLNSDKFYRCPIPAIFGRIPATIAKASPESGSVGGSESTEDAISLGTMKLPPNIDIARFETLLFQWANSLCQGANLPLPVPLKVDKIKGGVRLGFVKMKGDGSTEDYAYIDCLIFPATEENSGPIFRALRNGPLKDQAPPGEPRIMRSLMGALKKSIEIAKI